MAWEDLSDFEKRLFEYIRANDFESRKWSTPDTASRFNVSEDEIYKGLANLTKQIKDRIWIYYKDGGVRIVAE